MGGLYLADIFVKEFLDYLNLIHHISAGANDAKSIQNITINIAAIIQYKYFRSGQLATLKEELLQTDLLIEVFKERFGAKLQFIKNIKKEAVSIYIPNYAVLAFVENALFHGLIPKEGDWKLTLKIDENEEAVQITVTDNGVGFEPLEYEKKNGSIGDVGTIDYVTTQFKTFYNDLGELHISSSNDRGTQINIVIPKV